MKKVFLAVLAIMILASVVATGCTTKVEAYTDSGQAVNINLNQEFTIALVSNATTGYSWQPAFEASDLTLVKREYKEGDNAGGKLVGAAGVEYFTFKALKSGDSKVTFTYMRTWEQPNPQDKTASFTINIK